MRTVSPEDRYVAWARFNTHDGRSATTLHLCDSDAPGAFRVYRWEDVQDGAAREIKRLTAALERIRTGIAHDRCDGDSEFAAGVSAACRNHLELVNAAVAYGVTVTVPVNRPATPEEAEHAARIGACLPNGAMFDAFGRERVRYVRVIHDGTTCVVSPGDVADLVDPGRPDDYRIEDVYLSKEEFDALPEFNGF